MKKGLIIWIIGVFMVACGGDDKPIKPNNLIAKDKMENILYDLYVINAAKGVNRKIMEKNGFLPEPYVLTKHKIDSAQFANSNNYYAYDVDTYKKMVENVKARLEKDKDAFEKIKKEEEKQAKRKRDSLKSINDKRRDSLDKIKQMRKDASKKLNVVKVLDSAKIL